MEKVSFIATVYNEESTIDRFVDSILSQNRLPDEVVIVDGGSTDATWNRLQTYTQKFQAKEISLSLYRSQGNRSCGRNFAIQRAKYEYVAVSDAGCILDPMWLAHLMKPVEKRNKDDKKPDVVCGFYSADIDDPTSFQKSLASYTCVMLDQLKPESYLPSSRSVLFTKSAWRSVGKYPEELDTCEDLVFARRLREAGYTHAMEKKALVYWPQKSTIIQAAKQLYGYAQGDGQARYIRPQNPLLFLRYLVGMLIVVWVLHTQASLLFVIVPLISYILWSIWKNYRYVNHWTACIWLPLLQFTADSMVMSGTIVGLIKRLRS